MNRNEDLVRDEGELTLEDLGQVAGMGWLSWGTEVGSAFTSGSFSSYANWVNSIEVTGY